MSRGVALKSVAVPTEHGGWGFTLEPVLLGLWVASTTSGLGLGLMALAAFLARHPIKLLIADVRRNKMFPRTWWALGFALLYVALLVSGFYLAWNTSSQDFWQPLALALPFVVLQLYFDAQHKGRNLIPEISGAVAMGSVATAIALSGGTSPTVAWALWGVLVLRSISALYFARTQVMRARGGNPNMYPSIIAGFLSFGIAFILAILHHIPLLSSVGLLLLLLYQYWSFIRPPVPAKVVGWGQMLFGVLIVSCTAIGVQQGW